MRAPDTLAADTALGIERVGARASARMITPADLVVISNRTPIESADRTRRSGGLVSALEPALRTLDGVWLGWSGETGAPELDVDRSTSPRRATFDLPPGLRRRFYDGFCATALWPLLHAMPDRVRCSDDDWTAYRDGNAMYARFATSVARPSATVWVHDYQLCLVARAMRAAGHAGPIGLFFHAPFPPRDIFETLPWADELLAAIRAFDLVGFHTTRWADNFAACAGDRAPETIVAPLGIDPADFTRDGEPDTEVIALAKQLGDRKLILGVDRLDYAKGIPERLVAFERLLADHPEWRRKVAFVQVSVPSRTEVADYADLRGRVENLVGRINGHYGDADWVPVRYLYRSYNRRVLAQLYRLARVALVTPLRDGLNLVAKEFVASQDERDPGVLVLSRFAGASVELPDAILTNPYHPDGVAADLDAALRMPLDERRARQATLAAAVSAMTPREWARTFLAQLRRQL